MTKLKKDKTHFICQNCGFDMPRWQGRCPSCGEWNSFVEEKVIPSVKMSAVNAGAGYKPPVIIDEVRTDDTPRIPTKSRELDRVLGGGIVPGSVVLIGGDPGIGKSTLLLQEAAGLSRDNFKIMYVTGEESTGQIKMRADRLGLASAHLYILAETELEAVLESIHNLAPGLVVIDSIQTMYSVKLESAPGSISQVRECALQFIQVAKRDNLPILFVGHVTKEGYLAGPKVLEHMVDALLLFEGDREHFYRILRAVKNRFGSTREIGVFQMAGKGLLDVPDPSAIFLSERQKDTSGSAVICCMEGTRPILVEIQALVSPANYGMPQRTTIGFDNKRIAILLAVLEKRLGYRLRNMDVFINAVGGMRIDETSADMGVVACIASNINNRLIDPQTLLLGEVGLGGELRSISHIEARLSEAEKMGFGSAVIPAGNKKGITKKFALEVIAARTAQEALDKILN
ncbi:MAG TPA: DNA repair protein RadA [bacterium]|nr:DNA repair protein RadA [bacterium]HPN43119.1 DNA repair protein RadA [bacterium]